MFGPHWEPNASFNLTPRTFHLYCVRSRSSTERTGVQPTRLLFHVLKTVTPVMKMTGKCCSPTARHVSGTPPVDLDLLFFCSPNRAWIGESASNT